MAKTERIKLTEYFQAVEKNLDQSPLKKAQLRIKVCEKILEIYTYGLPQECLDDRSLAGCRTEDSAPADAVFFCWDDDYHNYIPVQEDGTPAVWKSQDETGELSAIPNVGLLTGRDYSRNHYYWCKKASAPSEWLYPGKLMAHLFSAWADSAGLALLHAAAIGVNGKGVLLAGKGGKGKSTLSLCCLLDGMDFVADDYTVIPSKGPLCAMPLYSIAGINPDMLAKLLLPSNISVCPVCSSDGKPQLDLSNYQFCPSLSIHAIVFPTVTGCAEPVIKRVPSGPVLTSLIYSSAAQTGRGQDVQFIKDMILRLGKLPVYEIQVSPDLMKNPQKLRKFIEEEL